MFETSRFPWNWRYRITGRRDKNGNLQVVRKNEILNDLEVAEKYLQTRKEKMSEIKSQHDNEQKSIKELIDVKIEQLRAKFDQKIGENLEKIGTEVNKRSNDVETVLKLQNDSRSVLGIPSTSLIKRFDSVKSASRDQLQMVEKVKSEGWSQFM